MSFLCSEFRGLHSAEMVDFMAQLKTGEVGGVKVKLGRLQVCCIFFLVSLISLDGFNRKLVSDFSLERLMEPRVSWLFHSSFLERRFLSHFCFQP